MTRYHYRSSSLGQGRTAYRMPWMIRSMLDNDRLSAAALLEALGVQCPVKTCQRVVGNACVLPAGLEHQGIFLHHERIAAGAKQ